MLGMTSKKSKSNDKNHRIGSAEPLY